MSAASKPDALIVSVMPDGRMFLGNESVTSEALMGKVRTQIVNRASKAVYVRADGDDRVPSLLYAQGRDFRKS